MLNTARLWFLPCLLAAASIRAQDAAPAPALNGLDPVELCAGREVPGSAGHATTYGRFRYVFASEKNATTFAKEPARYEIQMGGACGRMGPQSGRGSPGRFAVHAGHIYVFASDQCRAAFLKAPEKFLDPDDPAASGDDAAKKAGMDLVLKMVAAVGGAAKLDALRTCDAVRSKKTKTNEGEREDRVRLRINGRRHRLDQHFGPSSWTTIVTESDAFDVGSDDKATDLHGTAIRDFRREMIRNPFALLRVRNAPGFIAVPAPAPEGSTLEWVEISFQGATTAIGLDSKSGEFRETRHRGRGPQLWFGAMVRRYSEWKETDGLRVPHRVELDFDGKPQPNETRVFESIRFDVDVPDSVFARPKP